VTVTSVPFVFNRIYAGHPALLMGYGLLPFAVTSALPAPARRAPGALAPALWWAALTALAQREPPTALTPSSVQS
jgi:hypothetical protein